MRDADLTAGSKLAIELKDVSQRYGRHWVLNNLNLSVSQGKVVVLQGSNGAGKTTLLRLLSTRLRPSRGQAKVMGFSVAKEAAEVRQQIAYISVLGGNYGTLTAYENLRLAAKLYGQPGTDIEQRLAQVDLLKAKDTLARSFSSGMKKRLALARLLLSDAPLWLLDEPYAALDEAGKDLIDSLLLKAKASAKTVVMASHDIARSQRHADGVLTLEQGRLRRV